MEWSAQYSDINPAYILWDYIGRSVDGVGPSPKSFKWAGISVAPCLGNASHSTVRQVNWQYEKWMPQMH